MSEEKDEVKGIEIFGVSPCSVGHATHWETGLQIHEVGNQTFNIFVQPNNVLQLRDFCNSWMMRYGARDTQGRLVFDEATERE